MEEEKGININISPMKTFSPTPTRDHRLRLNPPTDPPSPEDHRVLFFGRRGYRSTWVISVFVILHLVAFVATMFLNNCPRNSGGGGHGGECILRPLGRFSFQPLYENPLLGPSPSTLVKMGALQRTLMVHRNKMWYLVTSPWLHAGVIHLTVNLSSIILVGIHLEQEFGPLRAAMIYLLSALLGSLISAVFVQHMPSVGSSGALFGLLGATVVVLVQNWKIYIDKFAASAVLGFVITINFCIGLLPYVDNFSNIGAFLSGILLGILLLFNPNVAMIKRKKGLFDYDLNKSVKLKQKLDKPGLRIIALLVLSMILVGGLIAALSGINARQHCRWCRYINCLPTRTWSCNEKLSSCKVKLSDGRLILTCAAAPDMFRIFPFTNVSRERMDDLCTLICP